jgi:FHA domain
VSSASLPMVAEETRREPSMDTIGDAQATSGGYDELFGETQVRSVEAAAVRPDQPPTEELSGDHDGLTVMSGDIRELRNGQTRPEAPARAAESGPRFAIELADGSLEPLDRALLVGRAPTVTKTSGDEVPRLYTVVTDDQDISRNHVRFVIEGDTVVLTDLHSRNGTTISLPGKPAQKLRPGEPTSITVGTLVDLGSGVTFTVRRSDSAAG